MSGFSEAGVRERALDTALTFETSFAGSWELSDGGSFGFDGGSLLGGFVAYVRTVRCGVYLGRRSRGLAGRIVLRAVIVRAHCCGSRNDHLAAGSMLGAFAMPKNLYVILCG
jgi:hypothetical protein